MNKSNSGLRKIVVASVMSAISIIMGITHLGFIPWFSGASLTIMHVPVIIGAILEGPIVGMITGLIFGVFSLIQASIGSTGPIDPYFTNPLISVAPRILIGLATWGAYRLFQGKFEGVAVVVSAIVGSYVNSILVLSALAVFGAIPWAVILGVLAGNSVAEAAAAAIISTAVILAWKGIDRRSGSSLEALEE
ncbi:ECF transporter S component [Spirochaeta cellobiosiphila]|uniref:ECF transporter S component n=1 Tax=Spirochaeta cellobiosiphila TaxID=504483 RepID=UPI0003FDED02|nr:ECF transporter S component [Spirochaeta cellobiosiphila]